MKLERETLSSSFGFKPQLEIQVNQINQNNYISLPRNKIQYFKPVFTIITCCGSFVGTNENDG